MELQNQNKEFISRYFTELSNNSKTIELLEKYIEDESLLQHIAFFEAAFPDYKIIADEMVAEDNRVVVIAHFIGTHAGELNGIAPTFKKVNISFVIRYTIENEKIVSHWMLADQMMMMEQLGVVPAPATL